MDWLETLFVSVWRASWQAGVIVLLILAFHRGMRGWLSPKWKTLFWWLALARLLLPFTPSSAISLCNWLPDPTAFEKPLRPASADKISTAAHSGRIEPVLPMPKVIPIPGRADSIEMLTGPGITPLRVATVVWIAGATVFLARFALGWILVQRAIHRARAVADPAAIALLEECRQLSRVRRKIMLVEGDVFDGPALTGISKLRLFLPSQLLAGAGKSEIRHIFLHELAHIRRGDLVAMTFAALLTALHWFNPFAWLTLRRMRNDAELAADEAALGCLRAGENEAYGTTILILLERAAFAPKRFGVMGILGNRQNMKERISMIATFQPRRRGAFAAAAGLGLITLMALTDSRPVLSLHAEEEPAAPPPVELSVEEEEIQTDKSNMLQIHAAICAYYRDHQDLPHWLSDLVPKYLPNPEVLVSPTEKRTGKSVLYGREDPRLKVSYIYEFNGGAAAEEFNKGRAVPITNKEWKLAQLAKFGLVTPILRCHLHQPVLNVAYSGDFYETGLLWENDRRTVALIKSKPALGPYTKVSAAQTLAVTVLDGDGNQPIADARVGVSIGSEFGLLPLMDIRTDDAGRAQFPLGDWVVNWMFVNVSRDGYRPNGIKWNAKEDAGVPRPHDITLHLKSHSAASIAADSAPSAQN